MSREFEVVWPESKAGLLIDPVLVLRSGEELAPNYISQLDNNGAVTITYRWVIGPKMVVAVAKLEGPLAHHPHRRRWLIPESCVPIKTVERVRTTNSLSSKSTWHQNSVGVEAEVAQAQKLLHQALNLVTVKANPAYNKAKQR